MVGSSSAPVALLVVLWEWVRRMEPLGDGSPLLSAKERHEAKDVAEALLRATSTQLSRSLRRTERGVACNCSSSSKVCTQQCEE